MNYVDGSVVAVPTANRDKFLRHAQDAAVVSKEHCALQVVECWGDGDGYRQASWYRAGLNRA